MSDPIAAIIGDYQAFAAQVGKAPDRGSSG